MINLFVLVDSLTSYSPREQLTKSCEPLQKMRVRLGPVKRYKKVQVGKDQEKTQSEKDSHSKNRGGKKPI